MHYDGIIIRPPSEADSILLQIASGCSHNRCTFCGTYKHERFSIKSDEVIAADIAFAARHCRRQRRVFLVGGDVLVVPQRRLVPILEALRRELPWVTRVGCYANAKSLNLKSDDELHQLRSLGLGILYMGVESGDAHTLQRICKGATPERLIAMGQKAKRAGFRLSVTVLLGVAGPQRSAIHAQATGELLSAMDPDFVGALTLMLVPGTPLHTQWQQGDFDLLPPEGMLQELRAMFAATDLSSGLFHANHASNYLPIKARLPADKAAVLRRIDEALDGRLALKPEYLRAL